MADPFALWQDSISAPARRPFTITPHDSEPLAIVPKALRVGNGGTIVLRGIDAAADVTFVNVADGEVLDVRAEYVRATGTTATDIVALA